MGAPGVRHNCPPRAYIACRGMYTLLSGLAASILGHTPLCSPRYSERLLPRDKECLRGICPSLIGTIIDGYKKEKIFQKGIGPYFWTVPPHPQDATPVRAQNVDPNIDLQVGERFSSPR